MLKEKSAANYETHTEMWKKNKDNDRTNKEIY